MTTRRMRVLAVIESGTWAEENLVGALRDRGDEVHVFHFGEGVGEWWGGRRRELVQKNDALLVMATRLVREQGLDLIFCYVYDDFLLPATGRGLRTLGVPMVNYNVDMQDQWYRQTRTARYFTAMLCGQRENMHLLAEYNARVEYFPLAARPALLDGNDTMAVPAPITFVGTPTPYRVRVLQELRRHHVPVAVFGKYWREGRIANAASGVRKFAHDAFWYGRAKLRSEGPAGVYWALRRRVPIGVASVPPPLPSDVLHGVVATEAMGAVFRGSTINLGFTRTDGGHWSGVGRTRLKLRDYEVPLAGGFYLVEDVPEYHEHFVPGAEVETWKTVDELREKAAFYLDHPEKRERMAARGRERARRDHTWQKRFDDLFSELGVR